MHLEKVQISFYSFYENRNLNGENCDVDVFFPQASFQRSNSHDKVRKIVAEEGRAARNLIAWSVPLENKEEEGLFFHVMPFSYIIHIQHIFPQMPFAVGEFNMHVNVE